MTQEIKERVIRVVRESTDTNLAVTEKSTLDDLYLDSLDGVALIMAIEEEFYPMEISDAEAESCSNVGDLINLVKVKTLTL